MRSRKTGETGNRTHGDEGTRGQEDKGAMEKGPALRIFWKGQSAESAKSADEKRVGFSSAGEGEEGRIDV